MCVICSSLLSGSGIFEVRNTVVLGRALGTTHPSASLLWVIEPRTAQVGGRGPGPPSLPSPRPAASPSCTGICGGFDSCLSPTPPPTPFPCPLQVSSGVRTPLRASRAMRAATGSPSPGAASPPSAACSASPPTTALTPRTTRPPYRATSPRAPSRIMCGTAPTSTRTSPSFLLPPWPATQVGALTPAACWPGPWGPHERKAPESRRRAGQCLGHSGGKPQGRWTQMLLVFLKACSCARGGAVGEGAAGPWCLGQ